MGRKKPWWILSCFRKRKNVFQSLILKFLSNHTLGLRLGLLWNCSLIVVLMTLVFIGLHQEAENLPAVGFRKGRMEGQHENCAPVKPLLWVKPLRTIVECAKRLYCRYAAICVSEATLSYLRITQKSTFWLKNKGSGAHCKGIVFWFIVLFWVRFFYVVIWIGHPKAHQGSRGHVVLPPVGTWGHGNPPSPHLPGLLQNPLWNW